MSDRISLHGIAETTGTSLACKPFTFSGGEPHVHLDPQAIENHCLWVDARLGSAEGFMHLLAVLDAVRGCRPRWLGLFLPYFPGARQDRRQPGTPFTLKIYAEAIRRASLDTVVTLDPHSDVLAACLDVEIIPAHAVMTGMADYAGWICPDAGAEKRVHEAARVLGQARVVHGRKIRDTATGKLSGFQCDALPTAGNYLVVDDICDGGGTFLGLADAIERHGLSLDLWVTHGIFSRGLDELMKRFRFIHTTDSFPFSVMASERLIVHEVHALAEERMRRRLAQ
jgi:ribose-phosphate pyrophosphokinase